MAQLDPQPRRSTAWIIWLIIIVVIVAIIVFFLRSKNNTSDAMGEAAASDSTTIESQINNNWTGIEPNVPVAEYDELQDTNVSVRATNDYAIYSLKESVLFAEGETSLGDNGSDKLKQIAASAEKRFAGGDIRIYGHTDSTGTKQDNKELALQRAEAVKNWLVQNGNISAERISLNPVGEADPISTNSTEKGRLQNRRVEIVVRKK